MQLEDHRMGKGKGGRRTRSGRQGGRREDHKQNLSDPTLDTKMLDAPHQSRELYKKPQNKSVGFPSKLENSNQGRVAKAAKVARDISQKRQSTSSNTSRNRQPPFRAGPSSPALLSENPFLGSSRTKSHRASIASCVSALSTKVGRGLYCYKCARTNRKLRQALFDLLERALKDGRKLIDEWAWEAGVSPDHMDCERTKMHNIPEGLQSEDEPCHGHKGKTANCGEVRQGSTFAPQTSQASGMSGPVMPLAGTQQPSPPLPQQMRNPFIPVMSGTFESQTFPMSAPQVPNGMTWTLSNGVSVAEQNETNASNVGRLGRASPSRAQHNSYQQHQQDHHSSDICQFANGLSSSSTYQYLDPKTLQSAHVLKQAPINSYMPNSASQIVYGGHPLMLVPHKSNVEDSPSVQVPQVQQHPSQRQPEALSSHFEYPSSIFTNPAAAVKEEDQSIPKAIHNRDNSQIIPPQSNEQTVRDMLHKGTGIGVGAVFESMQQGAETSPGDDVLEPDQGQQSHLLSSEQEQKQASKYVGGVDLLLHYKSKHTSILSLLTLSPVLRSDSQESLGKFDATEQS